MSRTKRFLGGVYVSLGSMVVNTIVGIWLARFLLLRVGQHDYGVWLVVGQILGYLDLLDLGTVALLGRDTAAAIGRAGGIENATELPGLIARTVRVLAFQTPLVAIVGVAVFFFLPADWRMVERPLACILIAYVVFFPMRVPHALLDGLQALRDLGMLQFVAWVVSTIVTIALVLRGWHVGALAAAYVARQFVTTGTYLWRLLRRYPSVIPRAFPAVPWPEARALMKRGSLLTAQKLGIIFLGASDMVIVDRGISTAAVVPYACTNRAYSVLENVPRMLLDQARPGLTEARAGASREHVVRVCNALTLGALLIAGFFAFVVFTVNEGFVTWWIGAAQWGGHRLSLLLAVGMIFRVWLTAVTYTAFAFSLDKRLTFSLILDGLVTVVASAALVGPLGYLGIPVGQMIGGAAVSLPLVLFAIAKDVDVSPMALLRPLFPWAWRFVLCMVAAYFSARAWTPAHLLSLLLTSTAASAAYWAVMLPCVLQSSLSPYVRRLFARPEKPKPVLGG